MAKKASKKATKKTSKKATTKASSGSKEIENEKICAILQYIFPVGAIWYLAEDSMKKSSLVKFHLKQVLVLVIVHIAVHIVLSIISFLWVIGWIFSIGLFVLWIIGLIAAINGEEKQIPLIGQFAKNFKF